MRLFLALAALWTFSIETMPGQPEEKIVLVEGELVSQADGTPVPRGTVVLSRGPGKPYNLFIREGRFSGKVPAAEGYSMRIWAPGFADFRANNVSVYEGMEPILLKLPPTRKIGGRIVDPEGNGIAGAQVMFSLDPEGEEARMGVVSREDGSFGFELALAPGTYYLLVRHPLYEDLDGISFSHSLSESDGLTIELQPKPEGSPGSIQGRAVFAGEAMDGAEVVLFDSDEREVRRVKADDFGRYAFEGLPPATYTLKVFEDGKQLPDSRRQVEVKSGEAAVETLTFEGPESVSGVVLGPTGAPLSGVRVMLEAGYTESYPVADTPREWEALRRRSKSPPVSLYGDTDAEGRFEIRGAMAGPYLLRLRCGPPRSDCPETFVSVEVPTAEDLEIQVEAAVEMHAILLDSEGTPVRNFNYQLAAYKAPGSGLSAPVLSSEGIFVIRGLKRTTYSIEVQLSNGQEAKALIDLDKGTDLVFKMPALGQEELVVQYVRQ